MKVRPLAVCAFWFVLLSGGCGQAEMDGDDGPGHDSHDSHDSHSEHASDEGPVGPHGGKLLIEDGFALEVIIFEAGIDPEFRVWASVDGALVDPHSVNLQVLLERLGGVRDKLAFAPEQDFLRSTVVVAEPHSFVVNVAAEHKGRAYQWRYDSFEGRTAISPALSKAAGIVTEVAGPATIGDHVTVYGQIVSNPENVSHVAARFEGVVRQVNFSIGDRVQQGQVLASIEANDSLQSYSIKSPITGTVIERHANPGESTAGRTLFTVVDTSTVWAELGVFPSDRPRVRVGAPVTLQTAIGDLSAEGTVALLSPVAGENQSVTARVRLPNPDGLLAAGMFLTGRVEVAQHQVPLAVRRSALQQFRDNDVVFARFGDTYEVRMLTLGRQDNTWVEVLHGLQPGTAYVTQNSYVIKADIEKSGASHDH